MEKYHIPLYGYNQIFLQIGQSCSQIPLLGNHSYGVLGKNAILYLVDVDGSVEAISFKGGFINRIKSESFGYNRVDIVVEVFTRQAGANPNLVSPDAFNVEFYDVL